MFKIVNRLCDAIECLVSATEALRESVVVARDWNATHGLVEARVEELERERALFESEIHGELLKAQAEYRKAGNAEKRAQTARDQGNGSFGEPDESREDFLERYQAWLRRNNDAAGEVEALQVLPEHVEGAAAIVDGLKARKRGA